MSAGLPSPPLPLGTPPPPKISFPYSKSAPSLNHARSNHKLTTVSTPSSSVATEKITAADEESVLAAQRKLRPLSPHLQIYRPEQTWFGASIWTRITGGALSGALYAYSGLYLVSPLLGWHVESSALVAAFAAMPFFAKGVVKSIIAWPFAYHALNGIRHLTYDWVLGFTKPQISMWAKIITGSSVAIALGLGFLY